jgi:hypothetical protein
MIKALKVLNQIEYQNSINSMEKVIEEVASGKLFTIDNFNLLDNNDKDIHWENEIKEIESEIINFEIEDQEVNVQFCDFARRLPCYAHTLQLVVNVILKSKSIRSIADKVRHLPAKINKSTPVIQKFKQQINCKPPSYCPTRWSSLYIMFNWFSKHQKTITSICESESWDHFSVTEWSNIEKIVTFLQLFATHTNLIQEENYVTVSNVLSSIIELTHHIINFMKFGAFPDNEILAQMKIQMENRFLKYQNPDSYCFDAIFVTATLLDPKFALVLNKNQVNSEINYLETFSNDNKTEVIPQDTQEVSLKTAFSNIQNLIIS